MAPPTKCTNSSCGHDDIRQIHSFRESADAVDGPRTEILHVTCRCSRCGHTWAVRAAASEVGWPIASGVLVAAGDTRSRVLGG